MSSQVCVDTFFCLQCCSILSSGGNYAREFKENRVSFVGDGQSKREFQPNSKVLIVERLLFCWKGASPETNDS